MSRQESGTMKRCSSCTKAFKARTVDGRTLVNGTECPSCEAFSRVTATLDSIRRRGEALDAGTN